MNLISNALPHFPTRGLARVVALSLMILLTVTTVGTAGASLNLAAGIVELTGGGGG